MRFLRRPEFLEVDRRIIITWAGGFQAVGRIQRLGHCLRILSSIPANYFLHDKDTIIPAKHQPTTPGHSSSANCCSRDADGNFFSSVSRPSLHESINLGFSVSNEEKEVGVRHRIISSCNKSGTCCSNINISCNISIASSSSISSNDGNPTLSGNDDLPDGPSSQSSSRLTLASSMGNTDVPSISDTLITNDKSSNSLVDTNTCLASFKPFSMDDDSNLLISSNQVANADIPQLGNSPVEEAQHRHIWLFSGVYSPSF
ncbi:unnamed protein product [Protopolystoma xenopodis]|uniref:Uncharacterized protein n=1 Tax=Protopolystoma xenopodis TaxID=117903 RepID=A0A448WEZ4_9PLAT|nr:unnamed protein product [Protopolystoma xenopodis]